MDYKVDFRKIFYNKLSKAPFNILTKKKFIASGAQGNVYKYCIMDKDNSQLCINLIGKKSYIDYKEAKFINETFTEKGLKINSFIDYAAMKLTNQLVLQNICPHFVLNYNRDIKERRGACLDDYPYKQILYNEFIDGISYDQWIRSEHTLEEWYNAYFQITISVYALQKFYNMTHLDMHSKNILVKKVKKGGFWTYKIEDTTYYVPNLGYIFYINDFDQVWVPNKFKSWFIRQRYSSKTIHKAFDLMFLFKSSLHYSTSPKLFKQEIRKLIKTIKETGDFPKIIKKVWHDRYNKDNLWKYKIKEPIESKLIEQYNFDKNLNKTKIPKELRHVVL
jgi:hypothetical protein